MCAVLFIRKIDYLNKCITIQLSPFKNLMLVFNIIIS